VNRGSIPAWEAAALVALTFAALVTAGARMAAHGLGGIVLGELICVIVPTLVFLRVRRVPLETLGLAPPGSTAAWPPWLATLGGLLCGAGAFYLVAVALRTWLERIWPTPPEVKEALERMVIPTHGARPLAVDLVAMALVPAVAEELLFRGVLFGAARPRLGASGAVVVSAVAFGLYHGSIYRFVPALLGGLLLGVVRAASGSLWPAIAFHVANNASVIVALHLGYDSPPAAAAPLAAAIAATGIGGVLVARRR
jgi:sodium transport system permease protein